MHSGDRAAEGYGRTRQALRRLGESLVDVGEDVPDRLDADREADRVGGHAGVIQFLVVELRVSRRGRVDRQ